MTKARTGFERAVEAVAVEIAARGRGSISPKNGRLRVVAGSGMIDLEILVRAVLLAIREPDEGMIEASNFGSYTRTSANGVWQAMIDHLLSQSTVGETGERG